MNQYLVVGIVFLVVIALLATNKKLVETLKNIYKIEELRKRVIYTIGLLLVYRLGSFVVIPGINPNALGEGSALASQLDGNGLLGLLNVFSGGAFGNAAIFALGVMPYITASIIIQLMGMMIPYFQKMQKEGESGRRKMNQWTRFLTIGVLILQGPAYIANLYHQVPSAFVYGNSFGFVAYATTILIAGTMFIMWLGEKITDKGIGNGISLIIMIGIVARLPHALLAEVNARFQTASGSAIMLILELVLLFLVFMATIALVQAVRKVPVQYAKRIVGNKQYGGVRQYIPLKMNAANVMPIIFAQALMFIPALFSGTAFAAAFSSMTGFWYNFTLAVLVIAFTYFYTAIIINPQMMADDMKRNGGFIPGVKPGKQTVNYIDTIMTRITLPGSFFLAIVAILPALAEVGRHIRPGVTTKELDSIAEDFIRAHGAVPAFLVYQGFPASLCLSVNEQVVHGIPSSKCVLKEGDIVSVDCGTFMKGIVGDSAYTFAVGEVAGEVRQLMDVTKEALYKGTAQAKAGNRVGDVSAAVQEYAESFGYGVVRELEGHGLGRKMHEDPGVPNYGARGRGPLLKEGMVICIEPMINMGTKAVVFERDGWTVRTRDHKPAAHYEFAVAVRKSGPDVLTDFSIIEKAINN